METATSYERIYYQVVLVDNDKGTFHPANGNGTTAEKRETLQEAMKEMQSWGLMFNESQNLSLAVQAVVEVVKIELFTSTAVPVSEMKSRIYARWQEEREAEQLLEQEQADRDRELEWAAEQE